MPLRNGYPQCGTGTDSLESREAWVQNPHGLLGTLTRGPPSEPHHFRLGQQGDIPDTGCQEMTQAEFTGNGAVAALGEGSVSPDLERGPDTD